MTTDDVPTQATVVVIGGGIVGCSVAYHLARRGISEIVLVDKHQLTSGTTWHAAGLVPQMRGSRRLSELSIYAASLYPELERETGQSIGLKKNGSLNLATTAERLEELRRGADMAHSLGVRAEEMGASEVAGLWPLAETGDITGAVFFPDDGQLNPVDLTMAFAKGARQRGVVIFENTAVTGIRCKNGRVRGIETENGPIQTEIVVNCAGMWARHLAHSCGVSVPLHACEHFYAITEPVEALPGNLPVLRDANACVYCKEDAGKLLIGAFEPTAKPWGMDGIPEDFAFGELPEDLDHFMPILQNAMERIPLLSTTGIQTFFNGPESFTPDDRYLLGEAPELKGFFVAAGFNSVGIQSAAGSGMVLAQWIDQGRPPPDLWEVDIRRTFVFQNDDAYLKQRVTETLGLLYAMRWPYRQYETARGIFKSPLHQELANRGACFGEVAGWERANWFATGDLTPEYEYSYGRQNWFPCSGEEHQAVREAVGLFDQTSFAKFSVRGPDAEAILQRLSTADVSVPLGKVVYTQWLNEHGGIEADLTITRLDQQEFRVITSAATRRRDLHWLTSHINTGDRCVVEDVTATSAVISLMGPHSRDLLQTLSSDNWNNEAFPFATAKQTELGGRPVLAQRITYVGELGWELYVPVNDVLPLFQAITTAGTKYGLRLCGFHALNSLRLEKGYRSWGHDINDQDTPVEAGLGFTCAVDKAVPFIGREAVVRQNNQGVSRRLLQFQLDDPEPLIYHDEPVFRDGRRVGYVTSGAYGYTLGRSVCLGLVNHEPGLNIADLMSGHYEIEIAGQKFSAAPSARPLYDPKGERVRS